MPARTLAGTGWMTLVGLLPVTLQASDPIVMREFIYEEASFPSCHASTLAVHGDHLLAAWFGGTREGHPDVGIWMSRRDEGGWSPPVQVASHPEHPCWNPVLYRPAGGERVILFYKAGPNPREWWGMAQQSRDGIEWSDAVRLPDGILGPIKNKPVRLSTRELLCGSSTEHDGWRVHMERYRRGEWTRTDPLEDPEGVGAIQPTILDNGMGHLRILCRSRNSRRIATATSLDNGQTWTALAPTSLPNPSSGIDAVTLDDGRHVLIYNHTERGRSPLNVAVSDDGVRWHAVCKLEEEPGEYSYPAIIQAPDGQVHVSYTWKRQRIRHVVLDPDQLQGPEIRDGVWPE